MDKKDLNNERLIIQSLPDDQLDALVGSNQLSAATANNIKAQRAGDTLRAEQAAAEEQARAERVAAIPDERVQANMNAIEDIAMQDTGVQPGHAPIMKPAPQAPSLNPTPAAPIVAAPAAPAAPAPAPAPAPTPAPVEAVALPTPEVQDAANKQAEQNVATQNAEAKVNNEFQIQEQDKYEVAMDKYITQLDSDIKAAEAALASEPTLGQKLGQAIAIIAGGYSQGLTGAKNNPVLDVIEKQTEAVAAKHKLNADQKVKLVELTLKRAEYSANKRVAEAKSKDEASKAQQLALDIGLKRQQLEKGYEESVKSKLVSQLAAQRRFTPEDVMKIPASQDGQELRERLVTVGKDEAGRIISAPAYSKSSAEILKKEIPMIESSQQTLKELVDLTSYFGNNIGKKIFDRKNIARADEKQQAIIGGLRLEYLGPGVITDSERALLESIVRNPAEIWSLSSANEAALMSVMDKLTISKNIKLRQNGIEVPKTTNEVSLEKLKQKYPTAKESDIIDKLKRDKRWVYGE